MKCSEAERNLSPYLDGELEAKDRTRLEDHLVRCRQCVAALERMRTLSGLFAQAERFRAPETLSAKVMEEIKSESSGGFAFWPVFSKFAGVAAMLLAITGGVISGGVLFNPSSTHRKGFAVSSALSLDNLDVLPPDSLGRAYLAMAEERR